MTWTDGDLRFPELDFADCPGLVVVAAGLPGETIGLGASMAALADRGLPVQIVAVAERLDDQFERDCAAGILGVSEPIRVDLPELTDVLTRLLAGRATGTWCAVIWRDDGCAASAAIGPAAALAAHRTGARLLEFPVQMWQWAVPGDDAVPWQRARVVRVPATAVARKNAAASCFVRRTLEFDRVPTSGTELVFV